MKNSQRGKTGSTRGSARVYTAVVGTLLLAGFLVEAGGCAEGSGRPATGSGGGSSAGGSGGMPATGGTGPVSSGGAAATGGSVGAGGGVGTGGRVGTGGSLGTGGAVGSGGRVGSGGGVGLISTAFPYSENFEDGIANGFISGIDDERAPLGTWAVVADGGTQVYREQTVTSDPSWAVGGDYRWTDQYLQTRVKIISGAADALIAIAVRFGDFKSYYFLEIRNDAVKIRLRSPATQTDLVSYSFGSELVDGTWYKFGLSAKGSTLAVYFNDVRVAMVTDATFGAGGIAFGVRDAVVAFDDITVTAPP